MASSKGYLDFIMEQLSELGDVTYRSMMGEYIIYYRGKVEDREFLRELIEAMYEELPAPKKRK